MFRHATELRCDCDVVCVSVHGIESDVQDAGNAYVCVCVCGCVGADVCVCKYVMYIAYAWLK